MTLSEQRKKACTNTQKPNLSAFLWMSRKRKYEEIKMAADRSGESVNGYIKKAIDERMERDAEE